MLLNGLIEIFNICHNYNFSKRTENLRFSYFSLKTKKHEKNKFKFLFQNEHQRNSFSFVKQPESFLFSAVDIESVVSLCCNEGNEWGTQRKHCNEYKFNLDKNIVPAGLQGLCLSTVEICCAKQHRIYQCTGKFESFCFNY